MNPFAAPVAQFIACAAPLLFAMFGALLIGTLAGWTLRPAQEVVPPELAHEVIELELKRKAAEEKLTAMRSALDELRKKAEEERRQRDAEGDRMRKEAVSLRQALVSATSERQESGPSIVNDPMLLERLAQLEAEAAKVPELLRELRTAGNEGSNASRRPMKSGRSGTATKKKTVAKKTAPTTKTTGKPATIAGKTRELGKTRSQVLKSFQRKGTKVR